MLLFLRPGPQTPQMPAQQQQAYQPHQYQPHQYQPHHQQQQQQAWQGGYPPQGGAGMMVGMQPQVMAQPHMGYAPQYPPPGWQQQHPQHPQQQQMMMMGGGMPPQMGFHQQPRMQIPVHMQPQPQPPMHQPQQQPMSRGASGGRMAAPDVFQRNGRAQHAASSTPVFPEKHEPAFDFIGDALRVKK